jgi:hypothetical protein
VNRAAPLKVLLVQEEFTLHNQMNQVAEAVPVLLHFTLKEYYDAPEALKKTMEKR